MIQIILQESGLLGYILSLSQPIIELNRFNTLFEDVKKQSTAFPKLDLFGYVMNLSIMEENRLKLEEKILVGNENAVTLTTAHKSKGLEWQVVYIYRFADTHWGNKTRREMIKLVPGIINLEDTEKEDKNSEERRLFYVAMTRAKQSLYLTGAVEYDSAKMIFPSMFLGDLPKETLINIKTKKYEISPSNLLTDLLTSKEITLHEGEEKYLEEIIKNFKLSPTALNSYLDCHYKFKLDNLYRIPRTKAAAMCFGTAVHHALENLYVDLNNTGKLGSKEIFIKDFEVALRQEIMTENDFNDRLRHGKKVLIGFYDHYEKEFQNCLFTEKSFGTSLTSQIHLGDIALTGKADRIDFTSHSTKEVRFVDYKTGKVRTRGEIEGTTKSSDGAYIRQLTFYHLLADLDKSFPYKVVQTELDFIEPDTKGDYHRERFNITDEDVENLKTIIKDSVTQIRSLNFDRTDDRTKCYRCPFLSHCWPLL
jgi:DNA helicase-2/ATP-dependent DNA helicase PcrA